MRTHNAAGVILIMFTPVAIGFIGVWVSEHQREWRYRANYWLESNVYLPPSPHHYLTSTNDIKPAILRFYPDTAELVKVGDPVTHMFVSSDGLVRSYPGKVTRVFWGGPTPHTPPDPGYVRKITRHPGEVMQFPEAEWDPGDFKGVFRIVTAKPPYDWSQHADL